jgi:PleD family two-component response regulator
MRTSADLYAAADEALYRAKELGRDRTELHDPLAARS